MSRNLRYGIRQIFFLSFLTLLRDLVNQSGYCLSICTGSALLAKAGVLDLKRATSNKKAFDWVTSMGEQVNWIRKARWVVDGKFYTSSGVSAGMDMTLGFINDSFGENRALKIAEQIEYIWNTDPDTDFFA